MFIYSFYNIAKENFRCKGVSMINYWFIAATIPTIHWKLIMTKSQEKTFTILQLILLSIFHSIFEQKIKCCHPQIIFLYFPNNVPCWDNFHDKNSFSVLFLTKTQNKQQKMTKTKYQTSNRQNSHSSSLTFLDLKLSIKSQQSILMWLNVI